MLDSVLDVFEGANLPVLATSEVADESRCSRPAAYNKTGRETRRDNLQRGSRTTLQDLDGTLILFKFWLSGRFKS